jgi:type IV pilus assembly protein PilA
MIVPPEAGTRHRGEEVNQRSPPRQSGFTLIELMLVVMIIGILAAVAVPAYQDYTIRARVSEALVLAGPAQRAVNEYYERWGSFPRDNTAAGLAAPELYQGDAVTGIAVSEGLIDVRVAVMSDRKDTRSLYLTPVVNRDYPTGPVMWRCHATKPSGDAGAKTGARSLEFKYVPASCRK